MFPSVILSISEESLFRALDTLNAYPNAIIITIAPRITSIVLAVYDSLSPIDIGALREKLNTSMPITDLSFVLVIGRMSST